MEQLGVEDDWSPRVASGFGGGMARAGLACGALTGAFMALGYRHGRGTPDFDKNAIYDIVWPLLDDFVKTFGSSQCAELIGLDLRDPAQRKRAQDDGIFTRQCAAYVEFAARAASELIKGRA
jgi:C_GCAxxG_C_C family probable redox protein